MFGDEPFDWGTVPPPPKGNYHKWSMMGVPCAGIIVSIKTVANRFYEEGKNSPTVVEVALDSGEVLALSQLDLLDKFIAAAPKVGDYISAAWTGTEQVGQGTKKLFTLNLGQP